MATTPNIGLEILTEGQANKEASITASHQQLDALVQAAVIDRDLTAPPGGSVEGDVYLVAVSAAGAWAGQDGNIAHYRNGAWTFITPKEGWRIYVNDEDTLIIFNGANWSTVGGVLAVQEGGSEVLAEASTLNFTGSGVSVADGGGGRADITISGGGSGLAGHTGLWEQIDRQEFSGVSSVTVGGNQTPSDYDAYVLLIYGVIPSNDGASLSVKGSIDGGNSTVDDYVRLGAFWRSAGSHGDFADESATSIPTSAIETGATNKHSFVRVEVIGPGSVYHKPALVTAGWPDDGTGSLMRMHVENYWIESTSHIDSFVIAPASGTVNGIAILIGIKKSETAGRLVEETGVSRSLTADDNNRIIDFTNAGTGVTVTVPDLLPEGFACRIVNRTGGTMTISGGGTLTIIGDTSFGQNQGAEIWMLTGAAVLVSAL